MDSFLSALTLCLLIACIAFGLRARQLRRGGDRTWTQWRLRTISVGAALFAVSLYGGQRLEAKEGALHYSAGLRHLHAGQFREAVTELDQVPHGDTEHWRLAEPRLAEARAKVAEQLVAEARTLSKRGALADALARAEEACTLAPDNPTARTVATRLRSTIAQRNAEAEAAAEAKTQAAEEERRESEAEAQIASAQDYRQSCQPFNYEQLARTPDQYTGQRFTLAGEVMQAVDSAQQLLVSVPGSEDWVLVDYHREPSAARVLEHDLVTAWGTFQGLATYTSPLGIERTVPRVEAQYLRLNGRAP